jgi:hypothetical protein
VFPAFNDHEVRFGLTYARNEYGVELNPTLLYVLASTVYKAWSPKRKRKPLDDVKSETMNRAFRIEFKLRKDTDALRKEIEAYSAAIGKMINNKGNFRRPGHRPDERMTKPPRPRKLKVVEESGGQLAVKH